MTPPAPGGLSRRSLLIRASRYAALGLVVSFSGLDVACGSAPPPNQAGGAAAAGVPRLAQGSPDFDLLDTLLQLEHRAAALAYEARQGRRLGAAATRAVDRIIDDHRAHIAALEQVVRGAGATPDPPRSRYSLPTPLGDEKRALGILFEDEVNLVSKYASSLSAVQTLRLAGPLGSLLFSSATHTAALERLLDRCPQSSFSFADLPVAQAGIPFLAGSQQGTPAGGVAPGPILGGLSAFETSAARMCALAAEGVSARFRNLEQRASTRDPGDGAPSTRSTGSGLEVSGYCLVGKDAEGRVVGPASADLPTAISILEDGVYVDADARTVVGAVASLLGALSSAHTERAAFWASVAEANPEGPIPPDTAPPPPAKTALPHELSPTAAGITEDRLVADSPEGLPPGDVFQAVQDTEVKTASALAVAASTLSSGDVRIRIAAALVAVATAASRLAALASGDDLIVSGI